MRDSKKFLVWLFVVLAFCAFVSVGGCGGGTSNNFAATSNTENESGGTGEDDPTSRGDPWDGFEDTTFTQLNGQWKVFSGYYTRMQNHVTLNGEVHAFYGSFKPSDSFRIVAYDDGLLVLADFNAGPKPKSVRFEPITAQFSDGAGYRTGDINIIMPAYYTFKNSERGRSYYEGTGYDGDTYQIEIDGSHPRTVTFIHSHKDNNGTTESNYDTICQMTNISYDY